MTDIEKRFAGNGDDGSLIERQLLSRASVKRKLRVRPTKNRVANLTPPRPPCPDRGLNSVRCRRYSVDARCYLTSVRPPSRASA